MKFNSSMILGILIPLLGNLACAGKSHKKNQTIYFVHGDPLSLVTGTQTSPSFLTPDNMTTYNGFHATAAISGFVQQEPQVNPADYAQVEQENSTSAASDTQIEDEFTLFTYSFQKVSDTRYVYKPDNAKAPAGQYPTLGFTLTDGKLIITDFDNVPVKEQHYSLKTDGKAFSLLFSVDSYGTYGRTLFFMTFADSSVVNPIVKASKDYAFLTDTVKLTWAEPIKVEACGTFDEKTAASIESSFKAWLNDPAATAEKRAVTYGGVRTSYPPFSDLNAHCIYLIDSLKLEASTNFYTAGVTLPQFNLGAKSIIDSDIMLFTSHLQVKAQISSGDPSAILMHESGHFFGLGHEFKTDASGKALHPSIMGYSQGTAVITDWDFEAIRDLYGMSLGPAA